MPLAQQVGKAEGRDSAALQRWWIPESRSLQRHAHDVTRRLLSQQGAEGVGLWPKHMQQSRLAGAWQLGAQEPLDSVEDLAALVGKRAHLDLLRAVGSAAQATLAK